MAAIDPVVGARVIIPRPARVYLRVRAIRQIDTEGHPTEPPETRLHFRRIRVIDLSEREDLVRGRADSRLAPVVHYVLDDTALVAVWVAGSVVTDTFVHGEHVGIGDGDHRVLPA